MLVIGWWVGVLHACDWLVGVCVCVCVCVPECVSLVFKVNSVVFADLMGVWVCVCG